MARPGPDDAGPSTWRDLPPVPRVSQVDAEDLDESLVGMLSERLEQSLGVITCDFSVDLKPEIGLLLKLVIFRYGIWKSLASPGSKLVNVHLTRTGSRPSHRILLLYLLLYPPIFPSYFLNRLRDYALSKQWPDLPRKDLRRRIWTSITKLEVAIKAWELVGWLWFLVDPRYPSLLMRLLRLQYTASSSHLARLVSYEFNNRQLVWSVFTEFLMYSLPMVPQLPFSVSPRRLAQRFTQFFTQPTAISYDTIPLKPSDPKSSSSLTHTGVLARLSPTTCPICHSRQTAEPIPLSSTQAGSDITLPPPPLSLDPHIPRQLLSSVGQDQYDNDDNQIFVPAQSDCWGRCRWCYYCIHGELVKHRMETGRARELGTNPPASGDVKETEEMWTCLRCGGGVTRAWRVLGAAQPSIPVPQAINHGEAEQRNPHSTRLDA